MENKINVNNDFMAGLAVFVIVMTGIVGLGWIWGSHNQNSSQERIARIEACENIEDAAERTLCLDK
jgi:hypothetical protein